MLEVIINLLEVIIILLKAIINLLEVIIILLEMVTNLASVDSGVLEVGLGGVKVGLRVPSVNIVLITENNRVMSLYFGTFNIPLQCTTTMAHRNTINSVTIKQLILRI